MLILYFYAIQSSCLMKQPVHLSFMFCVNFTELYVTLVKKQPNFDYGDYMIDSGIQTNIEKLERVQERIVHTIEYKFNAQNRENIEALYVKYNIEKLYKRRQHNLLKIMFDQSHIEENIEYYRPERVLRNNNNVKLKSNFTRITKIQRSPYYRGFSLWDKLPR